MKRSLNTTILIAAIGGVTAGCGQAEHSLVPVSGQVTRGSKPVAGASVTYQPMAESADPLNIGPGSFGRTDTGGRYTLRTFDTSDRQGAIVGRHRVTIYLHSQAAASDAAGKSRVEQLPSAYTDGSLIIDVPTTGLENANIDLDRPRH
ncbi:MAG: hypothetical protein IT427_16820 [Pirellulales bacterium]|nr:hypothetical protein [Pirellulales bacterium]